MRRALLVLLATCVKIDDRVYACDDTGRCPSPLSCVDGFCLEAQGGGAAGGSPGGGTAGGGTAGGGSRGGGSTGGGSTGGGSAGGGFVPNESCTTAAPLTLIDGGATVTATLTGASHNSGACSALGPDLFYSVIARPPITATLTRLDGGWTPRLILRASCVTGTYLQCDMSTSSEGDGGATEYILIVDSLTADAGGPFRLDVQASPAPKGDTCGNPLAVTLGSTPGTTVGFSGIASTEVFGCDTWDAGNDLFYALDLPDAGPDGGTLTATVTAARDMIVEVRPRGCAPPTGVCGFGNPSAVRSVPALPGAYLIVVADHAGDTPGPFTLLLSRQ